MKTESSTNEVEVISSSYSLNELYYIIWYLLSEKIPCGIKYTIKTNEGNITQVFYKEGQVPISMIEPYRLDGMVTVKGADQETRKFLDKLARINVKYI